MKVHMLLLLVASQCLVASTAFSARSVARVSQTVVKSSMSSITEQEAQYLMAKAKECAFSDTCSIEESQDHLHDVLNIQVACASGAVCGNELCDDQQEVAEVVAHLRQHIQSGSHGLTVRQQSALSVGLLPFGFLILTCMSMLLVNANPNVQPFTFQEVVWAARDGYLDDMVGHFLRNGGLLVGDANVVPFTFQEVAWAARGGYLDDMMSHFMRNGGL